MARYNEPRCEAITRTWSPSQVEKMKGQQQFWERCTRKGKHRPNLGETTCSLHINTPTDRRANQMRPSEVYGTRGWRR